MPYQHKSNIADKAGKTYNTVDEFLAEHGPLGLRSSSEYLQSATAVLNDTKTGIIRTLTFDSEAAMESWHEVIKDFPGRQEKYTATLVEKGEI
tara:strand:- start:101 stop:379 length:279 start_codon:yes stop_codon:yes gene_type:complete